LATEIIIYGSGGVEKEVSENGVGSVNGRMLKDAANA
jgi:hypothetical protein